MRRGAVPDQRETARSRIHRHGNLTPHHNRGSRKGINDRTGSFRAVRVEEVGRLEDLRVEVVCVAGSAEATAGGEDGAVEHEERRAVVVAGDGDGGHLRESVGGGVEELGNEGGVVVGEHEGEGLASYYEDLARG